MLKEKKKLNQRSLAKHKKRFLRFFPKGFRDQRYFDWERDYKWIAHELFNELLNEQEYRALLKEREHSEIANRALRVESATKPPFLFSFEKMALRDALREPNGARQFSDGLYNLLYGTDPLKERFVEWIVTVSQLPRKKSRVLSWPILTYFPFIAQPTKHIILKPSAMTVAADELGFDLEYSSKPSFTVYSNLLTLADLVKAEIKELKPRDYHDLQTFLYVIGSAEYEAIEADMD